MCMFVCLLFSCPLAWSYFISKYTFQPVLLLFWEDLDFFTFYEQVSSLEMTCDSNSVMAASIANNGTCPITGERVLKPEAINHVTALMYSCGMSINSGHFAFNVSCCFTPNTACIFSMQAQWSLQFFQIGLPAMSTPTGAIMLGKFHQLTNILFVNNIFHHILQLCQMSWESASTLLP